MPGRSGRKIVWSILLLLVAAVAFAGWYWAHFSMGSARTFEVPGAASAPRVLIASQGSEFKNAVVTDLANQLAARGTHVKVIDVSALRDIDETRWNAIVLVHTWEMGRPPAAVQEFVKRARDPRRLLALTTSGAGTFKLDGVDAISTASVVADAPSRAAELLRQLDRLLTAKDPATVAE